MPYGIVRGAGPRPFKIINKNTGEQVGSSETRGDAEQSINARNADEHGWRSKRKGKG